MAKKIQATDIYDVASFEAWLKSLDLIENKLKDILDISGKSLKSNIKITSSKDLQEQTTAINQAKEATKGLNEVEKQRKVISAQLTEAEKEQFRIRGQRRVQQQEQMQQAKAEMQIEKNRKQLLDLTTASLADMRRELANLKGMSFVGKSPEEIKILKLRMGELMDKIADTNAGIKALGQDTFPLMISGLKFISAGVEGVVGTLGLMGIESDKLKNVEKTMVQLIAVTQALAEIEKVLEERKLQAIAIRIRETTLTIKDNVTKWASVVATTAQARAEETKAVAVGKGNIIVRAAAAVQWLWNAALAANPIGLVVTGVIALVAAIGGLIWWMNKNTEATLRNSEAAEKYLKTIGETNEKYKQKAQYLKDINAVESEQLTNEILLKENESERLLFNWKLYYQLVLKGHTEYNDKLIESAKLYKENEESLNSLRRRQQVSLQNEIDNIIKSDKEKEKELSEAAKKRIELRKKEYDDALKLLIEARKKEQDEFYKWLENDRELNKKIDEERKKEITDANQEGLDIAEKEYQNRTDNIAKEYKDLLESFDKKKQLRDAALIVLEESLNKENSAKQKALDKEIDQRTKHQQLLQELATKGIEKASDNLAYEQKRLAEAEAKKQKLEQKQKQNELMFTALKTYTAKVEANNKNPLSSTIKDISLLRAFIASLPTFFEGIEDTGERGDLDSRGGKLAVLHPHERVVSAIDNIYMNGLTNFELSKAAIKYKQTNSENNRFENNEKILQKFDSLENTIKNQEYYLGRDFDKTAQAVIESIKKGNNLMRNHYKIKGLFT
ncbi:MAG: hypothetical protein WC390_07280 [Sulfurimonas sp.]|jgi:hypothetical protein